MYLFLSVNIDLIVYFSPDLKYCSGHDCIMLTNLYVMYHKKTCPPTGTNLFCGLYNVSSRLEMEIQLRMVSLITMKGTLQYITSINTDMIC